MVPFAQRYDKLVLGGISCFDRIIIAGGVREFGYAKGVEGFGTLQICQGSAIGN